MKPSPETDAARLRAIEAQLLAPGAPFELEQLRIGDIPLRMFKNRPRSLRDLLLRAREAGPAEYLAFFAPPTDSAELSVRRFTFAEHERHVAITAQTLARDYGVAPGDRVAIAAANCPEWVVTFWATISLGAICVGLNAWWTGDELAYALGHSEPKVLVGDRKRLERLAQADAPSVPRLSIDDVAALWASDDSAELPLPPIDEHTPAIMLYTSGTTGRPKGVVHTHSNVTNMLMTSFWHGARLQMLHPPTPREDGAPPYANCILVTSPLFHVSGLHNAAISGLGGCAKTVWVTGRFDPAQVIRIIEQERVTAWGYTSTLLHRLVNHPAIQSADLSSFRTIGGGGSALPAELLRATCELVPQCKRTFGIGYGLTEGTAFGTLNTGAELHAHPQSVGRPVPIVDLEIRRPGGRAANDGEEGDIHLRGPLVMKEYWRDPEATARAIDANGWLKTGDFGAIRDGHLYIASRKRDMIIRGGENIYPIEIEQRLEAHRAVAEAAVVGVDSTEFGQEVKAHVVLSGEADAGTLREWCSDALAYYKVPAHWQLRTEPLPRNATGKILKHALDAPQQNTFIEE